ncbi:11071_t:CDS:2 [Entrophospora sp. SA101]|nr:11071_t:CDS:2 [Entrophospora sp. SA101]
MPCPLAASNPKAWKECNEDPIKIFNLRPPECCGLPVSVFGKFLADYRNDELPIPKRRYKQISKLEKIVGQIYQNETKCQKALRPFFAFLFNGIRPVSIVTDNSAIVDDVLLTDNTDFGEKAAPVIWEYKNEIGTGGKDPTIQGGCEYAKYWAQTDIVKHRKYSCCPSIVLAIAGPWICVLRAIYLEKPVIELLTDFILMMNRPEDDGPELKINPDDAEDLDANIFLFRLYAWHLLGAEWVNDRNKLLGDIKLHVGKTEPDKNFDVEQMQRQLIAYDEPINGKRAREDKENVSMITKSNKRPVLTNRNYLGKVDSNQTNENKHLYEYCNYIKAKKQKSSLFGFLVYSAYLSQISFKEDEEHTLSTAYMEKLGNEKENEHVQNGDGMN